MSRTSLAVLHTILALFSSPEPSEEAYATWEISRSRLLKPGAEKYEEYPFYRLVRYLIKAKLPVGEFRSCTFFISMAPNNRPLYLDYRYPPVQKIEFRNVKFHHSNVTAQYPSLFQEGTRAPDFYIHPNGLSRSGINIIKSELFGNSTWNVVKYDDQSPTYSLRKRLDLERARELMRDCHENHGSTCSLEALLELQVGKKDSRMSRFAREFFSSLMLGSGGLDGREKSTPNFRLSMSVRCAVHVVAYLGTWLSVMSGETPHKGG